MIWKILNTPRGTNATYDISRRPLKTSKIVGSEEKIERSIAHFGDFYRLVSTRKSLYKKKTFSKKSIKIDKIRMPPLTVFSPEQIEIFRKRPRIEKNVIFFILDARAPPESIFQF